MKKEIKKLWLDALRSGKYKQTLGELRSGYDDEKKYCCLGVLTDICRIKTKKSWLSLLDITEEILSHQVTKWAGLDSPDPEVRINKKEGISVKNPGNKKAITTLKLSEVNDSGADFNTIADLIEKQL